MSGYIGNIPTPQATQTRDTFTATAGQTTFATSGYTPSFLDVFLNGVHLVNGTDYTASNGSDVVLTSGAAAGDVLEVVAYSTFEVATDDLTVTGTFTSRGIDDNATSTAMTLDTSGNLLVGKTVADTTTLGNVVYAGIVSATMSGDPAIFANRAQDGVIVEFQKNGATVGNIGAATASGVTSVYAGNDDTALWFRNGIDAVTPFSISGNTTRDAAINIGQSGGRFKDLYLSGGVYLGGTGAANYLDDYEEGTWTPSFVTDGTSPTISYAVQNGVYTKVGGIVNCYFRLGVSSTSGGSGNLILNGLPFTVAGQSTDGDAGGGHVTFAISFSTRWPTSIQAGNNVTYAYITQNTGTNNTNYITISQFTSSSEIRGTVIYRTSA